MTNIKDVNYMLLIQRAEEALKNAYSVYSKYKVGASVLTKNGNIYDGCNIENASYSLTLCAERTAIFKSVSEGEKEIVAIAIITETDDFAKPCGACRQVMVEFMKDDALVILANKNREYIVKTIKEILPDSFKL